jgi:hypothetical protein
LAQSGQIEMPAVCPLSGVKRTFFAHFSGQGVIMLTMRSFP